MRTKFSKTFTTWFFPVGGEALAIVTEWIGWLRRERQWGEDDALFPATQNGLGPDGGFIAVGLSRNGWNTTQPIRDAFKDGCSTAGVPYFNPHSVRDMLSLLGQRLSPSIEHYKAWSQNLGHNDILTTLTSYGTVPDHRQAELIRRMSAPARPATIRLQISTLRSYLRRCRRSSGTVACRWRDSVGLTRAAPNQIRAANAAAQGSRTV